MANWHLRQGLHDENAYSVLFHIPIPGTGSTVGGVQWRTALIQSGIGGTTTMAVGETAGLITAAEKADIASGAIYEHLELVPTNPGESNAQLRVRIDSLYQARLPEIRSKLQSALKYWGVDRNVT